jgi:hypothetical protein
MKNEFEKKLTNMQYYSLDNLNLIFNILNFGTMNNKKRIAYVVKDNI